MFHNLLLKWNPYFTFFKLKFTFDNLPLKYNTSFTIVYLNKIHIQNMSLKYDSCFIICFWNTIHVLKFCKNCKQTRKCTLDLWVGGVCLRDRQGGDLITGQITWWQKKLFHRPYYSNIHSLTLIWHVLNDIRNIFA